MDKLDRYIEVIVEPAFLDFQRNPGSFRHAYLACLVTYHAIDRAAYPARPGNLLKEWKKEWRDFAFIEQVALHFKHVESEDTRHAKKTLPPDTLLLSHALGLEGGGEKLDTRGMYFMVRDAIKFLKEKAKRK